MRRLAPAVLAFVVLGAAACTKTEPATSGGPTIQLRAGLNDPHDTAIAVLEFLPEEISVSTGTTVTWAFAGPEPHTVSYVPATDEQPAPGDAEFAQPLGPAGTFDPGARLSSGILPAGPKPETYSLTFQDPGSFPFFCALHPLMTGTVRVGGEADSQEDVTKRGDKELDEWLKEGRDAEKKLVSHPFKVEKSHGATTYTVRAGSSTDHTSVLAFSAPDLSIQPGDLVAFVNDSFDPHTATFPGKERLPPPDDQQMRKPTGQPPLAVDGTSLANSGWLPPNYPPGQGPPEEQRTFTFRIPKEGSYEYACILHASSGMAGKITVAG